MELIFLLDKINQVQAQLNQLEGYIETSNNKTFQKLNQSKLILLKRQKDKLLIELENKKKESIK
jgi:uncharacterized protein YdcH (DUF465 family)